jgi:hypothetical protein
MAVYKAHMLEITISKRLSKINKDIGKGDLQEMEVASPF